MNILLICSKTDLAANTFETPPQTLVEKLENNLVLDRKNKIFLALTEKHTYMSDKDI